MRLNGVDQTIDFIVGGDSGLYADAIPGINRVSLGAVLDSTAEFFEGGLKAITMYSGEKTDAEILQVETFLNDKYTIF